MTFIVKNISAETVYWQQLQSQKLAQAFVSLVNCPQKAFLNVVHINREKNLLFTWDLTHQIQIQSRTRTVYHLEHKIRGD